MGNRCSEFNEGDRVGVGWSHLSCGKCGFCREGMTNLCLDFKATGCNVNGGYAEYMTVPESSASRIPVVLSDDESAPLLCPGAIGYRSLRPTGLKNGGNLGLTGFIIIAIIDYFRIEY